jgi:cytochrome b
VAAVGGELVTPVLAHAGHWLVQLLYVAPVVFIAAVIIREKLRDKREQREAGSHPDPGSRD